MLQQILTDGFIDPELLAELNEDQKQTLFFKMREEQVRRWKERDAKQVKKEAGSKRPKKDPAKTVSWMKASDGDDWVWVMGDHPDDQSYDQICDGIMAQRAALQAQQEAEELRAKKEAELEKRFSAVHLDPELVLAAKEEELREKEVELREEEARQAAAKEQLRLMEELKKKEEAERLKAEEELRRLEEERAQQIYMDLKDVQRSRQHQDKDDKEDKAWQDSLRKSKVADQRRRSIAKQTREDYRRRSVRALEQGRVSSVAKSLEGDRPALPPKPKPRNLTVTSDVITQKPGVRRSPSCSSHERIIQWFRDEQLPLRAGFQRDQSRIATWFHGIISRQDAEDLLSERGPGYFLIRVSERILGYVLSYCSPDGCKHFLIDATDNCYSLLGDQLRFSSLGELVEYHEVEALTPSGGEQLLYACGQRGGTVDYADLFTRV